MRLRGKCMKEKRMKNKEIQLIKKKKLKKKTRTKNIIPLCVFSL